ncbi:CLUMA_CG001823, isoform A [Clunio marinus]|uniref:CLUMA_CG001823, isoform A n=1 Tax=Clunio marinus TaxID=568069 RepID=A0A1J1HJ48_9DIPT|nr:CLUMA_CG001823, isoform A [Clunio marinus]
METICECIFCQNTVNLYMINSSLHIGEEIMELQEVIIDLFLAKLNEEVFNFICEECKSKITEFYQFKQSARQKMIKLEVFDNLQEFLNLNHDNKVPTIRISENEFTISYNELDDGLIDESLKTEVEEEEATIYYEEENMQVEVEEEEIGMEPYFEIEAINDESQSAIVDPEFEIQMQSPSDQFEADDADKTYKCKCGVVVQSLAELQSHMQQHKLKPPNATNSCCGVNFKDIKYYQQHQCAHENFEAISSFLPSHVCNVCRVMYSCEDDLMDHLSQHSQVDEVVEDFLIERRSAYEDHFFRTFEPKNDEVNEIVDADAFSCGHCKKQFNEQNMKVHLLFFHTNNVICPIDNRCFEDDKQVRLFSGHIRNKHNEIFEKNVLYNCRHCNQGFATNFEKLEHMKQCEAKLYVCENHCNKRFATEWLLKNHLKIVQGEDRFSCETCKKRCVSRSDLQIHSRAHTNERPYSCPICHKRFKTSANRSSHMDIHEPQKKHECKICGEKFQTRPILRKHKKKHDEKYQEDCICKICERKYLTRQHVLRHLKNYHNAPADLSTEKMNEFYSEYL